MIWNKLTETLNLVAPPENIVEIRFSFHHFHNFGKRLAGRKSASFFFFHERVSRRVGELARALKHVSKFQS